MEREMMHKEADIKAKAKRIIKKHPYLTIAGGASLLGAALGATNAFLTIKKDLKKKKEKSMYHPNSGKHVTNKMKLYKSMMAGTALSLGTVGLRVAAAYDTTTNEGFYSNRYNSRARTYSRPGGSNPDWRDLAFIGVEEKDIKTKKDLQDAYRRVMMKEHPDKGGSPARSKAINEAMENIKKTIWYHKLAFDYMGNRNVESITMGIFEKDK